MEYVILIGSLVVGFFYGVAYAKFTRQPDEIFTRETASKVYQGLIASGLDDDQTRLAISFLNNRGIVFREPVKPNNVVKKDTGIGKGSIG
jgi:hypothetical protein